MVNRPCRSRSLPLLMLPGTLCDTRAFGGLDAAFPSREVTVVELPDLPSTSAMAARLLARAPRRFAIAGLSLGGIVALEAALAAPARIAGLALIGANAQPAAALDRSAARSETARAAADLPRYAAEVLAPLYAGSGDAGGPLDELVVDMAQRVGASAFLVQAEAALTRPDLRGRLVEIRAETLVLAGEADRLGTPEKQRELSAGIRDATLCLLPDVGHLAPVEARSAVRSALTSWLKRVDEAEAAHGASGENQA